MQRITIGVASLLALAPWSQARAQKVPDQHLVVPGARIGRVFLGDSRATVQRRLGRPARSFKLSGGVTSEVWRSLAVNANTNRPHTLEVLYRRGVAVQIEATNPTFRTSNGVSANRYAEQWIERFGTPRQTRYSYAGDKPDQAYYSWSRRGITLETQFDSAHDEDDVENPNTVIVHRKGVRAIPDAGGRLAR